MSKKEASSLFANPVVRQVVTVVSALVIVVLIFSAFYFLGDKVTDGANRSADNQSVQNEFYQEYQAVFLSNGQAYFGQIESRDEIELVLTDIYYLQVNTPLQAVSESDEENRAEDILQEVEDNNNSGLTLVKLGSEIHGPTDRMMVNMGHVLFIEDLRDDSRVAEAIKNDSL